MKVCEFEKMVLEVDHIVIVIRASENAQVAEIEQSKFKKSPDDVLVADWFRNRIRPFIRGNECTIISGYGYADPHPRTTLGVVRRSYEAPI